MSDTLEVQTYDPVALAEIEMIANLMIIATSAADRRLSSNEIDRALGLDRRTRPAFRARPG